MEEQSEQATCAGHQRCASGSLRGPQMDLSNSPTSSHHNPAHSGCRCQLLVARQMGFFDRVANGMMGCQCGGHTRLELGRY